MCKNEFYQNVFRSDLKSPVTRLGKIVQANLPKITDSVNPADSSKIESTIVRSYYDSNKIVAIDDSVRRELTYESDCKKTDPKFYPQLPVINYDENKYKRVESRVKRRSEQFLSKKRSAQSEKRELNTSVPDVVSIPEKPASKPLNAKKKQAKTQKKQSRLKSCCAVTRPQLNNLAPKRQDALRADFSSTLAQLRSITGKGRKSMR